MAYDEIIVLIISAFVGIGSVVALKFILKDKFNPILISIPFSIGLGYAMMWFTSDSDTILTMLKDVFVWAFIFAMFYVNGKCLIKGSRSRVKHGRGLWQEVKAEYRNVANTFKRKPKEEQNTEEDTGGGDNT